MYVGRIVSSLTATLAVAGCAVVAIGMTRAHSSVADQPVMPAIPSQTARPAFIPPVHTTNATSPTPTTSVHSAPSRVRSRVAAPAPRASTTPTAATSGPVGAPTTSAVEPPPAIRATSTAPPPVQRTTRRTVAPRVTPKPTPAPARRPEPKAKPKPRGGALPLGGSTGNATRVITVDAHSYGSTTATLQEWNKAPGGGWLRRGTAVTAHLGSDGLTRHASESRSATPIGSFTLTRAFGYDSDPGTALPYLHTTPADWWISQPGKLYNTLQQCSSNCSFNQGSPNEHLYYETPFYNYAVVIDYNTRNAPGGVHQGRGSAFFLHVTDGRSTAGCVSIPQQRLINIMRWLTPSAHPRIMIGVT